MNHTFLKYSKNVASIVVVGAGVTYALIGSSHNSSGVARVSVVEENI